MSPVSNIRSVSGVFTLGIAVIRVESGKDDNKS